MSVFTERDDALKETVFATALEKTGLSNMSAYGPFRGIFETVYKLLNDRLSDLDKLAAQTDLDNATGVWLTLWAIFSGVARKSAVTTAGSFSGVAYESGKILSGSWIAIDGTSLRFKVVGDLAFSEGAFSIPVVAEFAGSAYNLAGGTSLYLSRVTSGVTSITAATGWITTLGTDEEDDDSLRARVKAFWKSIGDGNPPSKYEYLAASISGVSQAKVIRTPRGYGSTDVIISTESGMPSAELLAAVRSALYSRGIACRDLLVKAPTEVPAPIAVEFSGSATESAVKVALEKFVLALSIGGKLEIRKLYTTAVAGLSLDSFVVITPERDIQAPAYGKIIPAVTVTRSA